MKFLFSTLALVGGTLPGVFGSPSAPGCNAGSVEITSFTWFNSSSNLNCPLANDPDYLCYTGKPVEPAGYGPPDYVSFTVRNTFTGRSSSCIYQNPGSVPATGEPGRAGITKCSTGDQSFIFNFIAGPSNGMGGSAKAELSVTDRVTSCNGAPPSFDGKFALTCSVDAGQNSTCTQTKPSVFLDFIKA